MTVYTALIVDDEPIAREIIQTFLQGHVSYRVAGMCRNAMEAFAVLHQQEVDVMFLDINMPEINGMDFVKMLKNPPLIVFTTAYAQYAVESYTLHAADYLLKPISRERFAQAITKLNDLLQKKYAEDDAQHHLHETLFVRAEGQWHKIIPSDIQWVEGLKDYVRLWTVNGRITIHSTMKNMEEQLAAHHLFTRIHKSYIVNFKYVTRADAGCVYLGETALTIGNSYKQQVQEKLRGLSLL